MGSGGGGVLFLRRGPGVAPVGSPGTAAVPEGLLLSREGVCVAVRLSRSGSTCLKAVQVFVVFTLSEGMILEEKGVITCEHLRTMRVNPVSSEFTWWFSYRGSLGGGGLGTGGQGPPSQGADGERRGRPAGPSCVRRECPQLAL